MTRINCVPVQTLTDQHLVAEYREMLRYHSTINRWLKSKKPSVIPKEYTLGKGHVTFFNDKGLYLIKRHAELRLEMIRRGMNPQLELKLDIPQYLMNDWTPDKKAIQLNQARLNQKIAEKPNWYKFTIVT